MQKRSKYTNFEIEKFLDKAVEEFRSLNNTKPILLPIIEWWLLKYSDLYCDSEDNSVENISLSSKVDFTAIDKFRNLFEELNTICQFKRKEKELRLKVDEYNSIDSTQRTQWLRFNEVYLLEHYHSFRLDYLDYNSEPYHLKVFIHTIPNLEIEIDRKNFKLTLSYLSLLGY